MVVFTVSKNPPAVNIVDILSRGCISDAPRINREDRGYEIRVAGVGLAEIRKVYGKDSTEYEEASKLYAQIVDMYKWKQE